MNTKCDDLFFLSGDIDVRKSKSTSKSNIELDDLHSHREIQEEEMDD